jgi:hypothetical protein
MHWKKMPHVMEKMLIKKANLRECINDCGKQINQKKNGQALIVSTVIEKPLKHCHISYYDIIM